MGDLQPPIVIRESRWKAGLLCAGSLAFVATGLAMVRDPSTAQWKGWLVLMFSGVCAVVFLGQLVRPSTLTLDPAGFHVDLLWRTWSVRWDQASNFRIGHASRGLTRYVGYDYKPDRLGSDAFGSSGQLPSYWTLSPPKLLALMIECKARWGPTAPRGEPTVS